MDRENSEGAKAPTTIWALASKCISGFSRCVDSSHNGELEAIVDAHGRFNVWAANVGALQPPHSSKSLDSRLKDAELMRTSVMSGLERLAGVQTRITKILTGEQQNRKATTGTSEDVDLETEEPAFDELHELLLNMKTCIDHLFGLSMLIRRLRPRGRVRPLNAFQPSTSFHRDIVTVTDKFPKVRQLPWLAERLGRATDQRRQFFTYRQQHRVQLGTISKTSEHFIGEDNTTLEAATTVATTFEEGDDGPSEPREVHLDRLSVVTTATSFVSDFDESGQMGRHIPELPDMTLDGVQLAYDEPIECPYCRTIQTFTNRLTWKKHVFSDLQPYVCTFENCSESPFSTRNEWFQHELDNHRRRWECILCDNSRPKFSHKDKITSHFKDQHDGVVTDNQVDLIIGACETPMTKFDASACPLCSEWVPPSEEAINTREFRRHLARHLQQISLEALPLYIEGLEINENPDEDVVFEYNKGIAPHDAYVSSSLLLAAGDEVLVLDNMFDEDFWHVHGVKDGVECQIPSRFIKITGVTKISLGKPKPDPSKVRLWTTRAGFYSAPAQFIGIEDDKIILHKLDGVKIKVPRENLSIQDLEYVDNIAETQFDSEDNTDSESTGVEERERLAASNLPKAVYARIRRYVFASDIYWFHVEALLEDSRTWKLVRNYQDFYDLQIALLQEFPEEAGNTGTRQRTLPYMPGPVNYVTDAITEGRMHNLDAYLKKLLTFSRRVAGSTLVRQFFAPRDGDEKLGPMVWSDTSVPTVAASTGTKFSGHEAESATTDSDEDLGPIDWSDTSAVTAAARAGTAEVAADATASSGTQQLSIYEQEVTRQRAMDEQQSGIPEAIQRVVSHLDPTAPIRLQPSPAYYPKFSGHEVESGQTPDLSAGSSTTAAAALPTDSSVYRVQLDFKPAMDDELEVHVGEVVRIQHEYDDGWALCTRLDRSAQGVVPRTCLSTHPIIQAAQTGLENKDDPAVLLERRA